MHIASHRSFVGRALLLVLASALSFPALVAAQPQGSPTYDFVVRAVPLQKALEKLVNETRIDLYYDPPLVVRKRANCAMQDATAEHLLRCILTDTGLDFIRLSSGLYVLMPASETAPLFGRLSGIVKQ